MGSELSRKWVFLLSIKCRSKSNKLNK